MKSVLIFFLLNCFTLIGVEQQLILMRHGQATNNVAGVYNSNPAYPNYRPSELTELGKSQVQQTAHCLLEQGFNKSNVVGLFSSPLPRCVQTATILIEEGVAATSTWHIDERLIERDAKQLEGKPSSHSYSEKLFESQELIDQRIDSFYHSIVKQYPEGTIIIVTHSAIATALIRLVSRQQIKLKVAEAVVLPLCRQ